MDFPNVASAREGSPSRVCITYGYTQHYLDKASKARSELYAIFAAESLVGSFPIQEGLRVYMARIDPHLTSGCEVIIDVDDSFLELLEAVQVMFLRRLLGLPARCSRAVLFTETGILPIRYRRIILALLFLIYLQSLDHLHYARHAFNDSINLWLNGHPCWIGDLQIVLGRLPIPVHLTREHITETGRIPDLIKLVERSCSQTLLDEIGRSPKTFLLWGRSDPLTSQLQLQPYLKMVHVTAYRRALIQLATSNHSLAVERLRWKARRHNAVPRNARLCRLCKMDVEDEKHALFLCNAAHEIRTWRTEFFDSLREAQPELLHAFMELDNDDFIRLLIQKPLALPIFALAKLAYRVFTFFDKHELYIPSI